MVQVITQKSAPSTPDKPIKAITKKRDAHNREEAETTGQARASASNRQRADASDDEKAGERDHEKPSQAVAKESGRTCLGNHD